MKRFFHIAVLFFTLALSLMLGSLSLQAQPIESIGYVQNVKAETLVLASNNLLAGEIYSNQEEEIPNYSGNSHVVFSFASSKANFDKNKTQLNGCFIHNLSTNKQKVHQIRAP